MPRYSLLILPAAADGELIFAEEKAGYPIHQDQSGLFGRISGPGGEWVTAYYYSGSEKSDFVSSCVTALVLLYLV